MSEKEIRVTGRKAKRIRAGGEKLRRVDPADVREGLGAEEVRADDLPRGAPLSLAALRRELAARLRSTGGRPSLEGTSRRQKIPLTDEDWQRLKELASKLSEKGVTTAPSQVASAILHRVLAEDLGEPA